MWIAGTTVKPTRSSPLTRGISERGDERVAKPLPVAKPGAASPPAAVRAGSVTAGPAAE
jgi:hypothetical protein